MLAGYDHPHLPSFAAVTTNAYGAGRVTYVGTVPDRDTVGVAGPTGWPTPRCPPTPGGRPRPDTVTCTSSVTPDGRALRFLHNWSWEPADYRARRRAVI